MDSLKTSQLCMEGLCRSFLTNVRFTTRSTSATCPFRLHTSPSVHHLPLYPLYATLTRRVTRGKCQDLGSATSVVQPFQSHFLVHDVPSVVHHSLRIWPLPHRIALSLVQVKKRHLVSLAAGEVVQCPSCLRYTLNSGTIVPSHVPHNLDIYVLPYFNISLMRITHYFKYNRDNAFLITKLVRTHKRH